MTMRDLPVTNLPVALGYLIMLYLIIQCVVAYVISKTCWRILRRLVVKTDLDNVPGPASHSFLKGNFSRVWDVNGWDFHKMMRKRYGRVALIHAVLGDKQLYVSDPKALHHIVVKDQHIFEETGSWLATTNLIFGKGLLSTLGDHHRKQRKMLNPIFSIAHMREMIPIFYQVTRKVENTLASKLATGPQEVDIMHWMTRTALELIAQSGLGYSVDSLTEGSDPHPYSVAAKQLTPVLFTTALLRNYLLTTIVKLGPPNFRRFLIDLQPLKNVKRLRDIIDVMHNTSAEILEAKRRALQQGDEAVAKQVGGGKDIMSVLLRANMEASEEDRIPDAEVLGQMSTLIFAGMDTTSNALCRSLDLLAAHPEIQDKLRQEILSALDENGGQDFSYDELVSLPFLDAVCRETLRLYPPFSLLLRTAVSDAVLPLFTPITGIDGREMDEIVVPKDTIVIMSLLNCNRDPALWGPDSYEWKPERWMSPLPDSLTQAPSPGIYSHLMTFLGGGRACIGFKFSQLEIKVVLSILLSKFRFAPAEKEIVWEMSSISVPTEKGQPGKARMPMQLIPVKLDVLPPRCVPNNCPLIPTFNFPFLYDSSVMKASSSYVLQVL